MTYSFLFLIFFICFRLDCEQPTDQMRNQTGFRCPTPSIDFLLKNLGMKCVLQSLLNIRKNQCIDHSIGNVNSF